MMFDELYSLVLVDVKVLLHLEPCALRRMLLLERVIATSQDDASKFDFACS